MGWKGINIEPHKAKFNKLVATRPKDNNLNIGIANKDGSLTYYETIPDTHSTFTEEGIINNDNKYVKLHQKLQIPVKKLSSVLTTAKVTNIDFMSIDTEGFDLEVLKSNDWEKYRPTIICIEINKGYTPIHEFLKSVDYIEIFNNDLNSLFITTREQLWVKE